MREKKLSWRDICKVKEDPPFFTEIFLDNYIDMHTVFLCANLTSQWYTTNYFGIL